MKSGLPYFNTYNMNGQPGESLSIACSSVSTSATFGLTASKLNYDCMITNTGSKTAYIAFGSGTATANVPSSGTPASPSAATSGATPILGGAILVLQKNTDAVFADTVAGITSGADTTSLVFTSLQGN